MTAGTTFYVRVPQGQNEAWRVKHADETVHVMSAFFVAPHGAPVRAPDGTYEVRAPAPSSVDTVRRMLIEHEGLVIVRERRLAGDFTDLIAAETPDGQVVRPPRNRIAAAVARWLGRK